MLGLEPLHAVLGSSEFECYGVVPVSPSTTFSAFEKWVDQGMHASMDWIASDEAIHKRRDPRNIMQSTKAVISLAFFYTPPPIAQELLDDPSRGIIARYALYKDYHKVVKKKLVELGRALEEAYGEHEWRAYVDTGPFLEREWAERAGLGFVGRNSLVINSRKGSYFFIAEILTSLDLPEWKEEQTGGCARCFACKEDCPTEAIIEDGVIDSRRCISYFTIEHKGAVPEWMRPKMRNRIYGCDICQEVCPWNKNAQPHKKDSFPVRSEYIAPPLETLLFFDDASFDTHFAGSPIRRAKREGFMRNVSVALGNWRASQHKEAAHAEQLLQQILVNDPSELVREHAQWGLQN